MDQEKIQDNEQIKDEDLNQLKANIIQYGDKNIIYEGLAKIHTKYYQKNQNNEMVEQQVFYNPVQIFNRDLTVYVIKCYIELLKEEKKEKFEDLTILDALSASGLRAIRFLKELDNIKQVYANDICPRAHEIMKENFDLNNLDTSKIKMTLKDATELMYEQRYNLNNNKKLDQFDIIDLDPYGTAIPFMDASIQSLRDGLLCLTCTDSRTLCGFDMNKCFYTYGVSRSRVAGFQENSIRIVLSSLNNTANKYGKYLTPLLCYQSEFYVRVFVRVQHGKSNCWDSFGKIGNIFHCDACYNFHISPYGKPRKGDKEKDVPQYVPKQLDLQTSRCDQCDSQYYLNGPLWLDQINDKKFISNMYDKINQNQTGLVLKTEKKISGLLYGILQEFQLPKHIPMGYSFEYIARHIKCNIPSKKLIYSAIQSLGYVMVQSYSNPKIYKTDAPYSVLNDIFKSFKLNTQGQENYMKNIEENTPAYNTLKKEIKTDVKFDEKFAMAPHVPHYYPNPQVNWGPGTKASKKVISNEEIQQLNLQDLERIEKKQKFN